MRNVTCNLDCRKHTDTMTITPSGALLFELDRVSLRRAGDTLWSMERAKFMQWQTSSELSDAEAA
eukprot:224488-Rhodomonas_salina.1